MAKPEGNDKWEIRKWCVETAMDLHEMQVGHALDVEMITKEAQDIYDWVTEENAV